MTPPKPTTRTLRWCDAHALATALRETLNLDQGARFYGVPRGGIPVALMMAQNHCGTVVDSPEEADCIVDDIIDSGRTRDAYAKFGKPFGALVDHSTVAAGAERPWIVFPWETGGEDLGAEDNVRRLLQSIGENPDREGLLETPARFIKAMRELTRGLHEDPKAHLSKSFALNDADAGVAYDEMIISRAIPFTSLCEHHLLAFTGHAYVGYVPEKGGRVVGLSKLARLVEGYACRPQVQERLTAQVINAIEEVLQPVGCAVIIEAKHTCQCLRGVKKDGSMVTSALRGSLKNSPEARAEFIALARIGERG